MLQNQDHAERVFGQFAVGALEGTFDKYEAALGVVRAMVAHADRERRGRSLRNMQYTNALDTFAHVLFSISPAAYRVFRQSSPDPVCQQFEVCFVVYELVSAMCTYIWPC